MKHSKFKNPVNFTKRSMFKNHSNFMNQSISKYPVSSQEEVRETYKYIQNILIGQQRKFGKCIISQEKIADIAGVTRETVNRIIKKLCESGFISKSLVFAKKKGDNPHKKRWGYCMYKILVPIHDFWFTFIKKAGSRKTALDLAKEQMSHLYNNDLYFIKKIFGPYLSRLELRMLIRSGFIPQRENTQQKPQVKSIGDALRKLFMEKGLNPPVPAAPLFND